MKKGLRRLAVAAVAILVAVPALATVASANATFSFDRIAGADRYATSAATATAYGNSTNVILASGEIGHYPDALTASYLAGSLHAPVMLTTKAATPANVLTQIVASGATHVYLIGGTDAISAAQETALAATYTVTRLGGADRYATSALVIAQVGVATSTTHTALLATGVNFPDALGGGPLSYVKGMPMALTLTDSLPAATLSALKTAGVTNVIVLGGTDAISANVIAALAAAGITLTTRLGGADRAETSSLLAAYEISAQGFTNTAANLASGDPSLGGVDALGAAPLSGQENRSTLITNALSAPGVGPFGFLTAHSSTLAAGHIFGGIFAVDAASAAAMEAAAQGVPTLGQLAGDFAQSGRGFGQVRPTEIFNGGDPTGLVTNVLWSSWGGQTAVATGISDYVGPNQTVSQGTEETATVVAFNLGTCDGRLMYRSVQWYFPQHGQVFDPNRYEDICTGSYIGVP